MKDIRKHAADHHAQHVHKIKAMATGPAVQPRAHGGKVSHDDVKEDRGLVKKMVKPNALTGRKAGGPAKHGKTQVNVLVGGRGSPPNGAPPPMPVRSPAPPPMAAGSPPPMGGGLAALKGALPPGGPPMARKGGKVSHRAAGGSITSKPTWQHAGAGSGDGRLEKEREYGVKSKTKSGIGAR